LERVLSPVGTNLSNRSLSQVSVHEGEAVVRSNAVRTLKLPVSHP